MNPDPSSSGELVFLVRRFQSGDVQAFRALIDRFGGGLGRFLSHLLFRDRGVVQDLLQDVWLKAWTHRESLRDPAKVKAWLYRIAHREALHVHGDLAGSCGMEVDVVPAPDAPPEDILVREEDLGYVMASFCELPSFQKEVIWLSVVEGLPHAQIARILDVPEGTCRSRLHYALEQLRKAIETPKAL